MLAEYLRILFIVFPFFFAFILLEYFITNHKKLNVYNLKDLVASSTFGIGTILMAPMIKAIITTSLFFQKRAPHLVNLDALKNLDVSRYQIRPILTKFVHNICFKSLFVVVFLAGALGCG